MESKARAGNPSHLADDAQVLAAPSRNLACPGGSCWALGENGAGLILQDEGEKSLLEACYVATSSPGASWDTQAFLLGDHEGNNELFMGVQSDCTHSSLEMTAALESC